MKKRFIRLTSTVCATALIAATGITFAGTQEGGYIYAVKSGCMPQILRILELKPSNVFADKLGCGLVENEKPSRGNDSSKENGESASCYNGACDDESGSHGSNNDSVSGSFENGSGEHMPSDDDSGNSSETSGEASVSAYASRVAALVNSERKEEGLTELTLSSELSRVAQAKAEDMRDNGYFSHTSPTYGTSFQMMQTFGINYSTAGENIAKGQKTPESVMSAWMNSQGHKANILSTSYKEIGIGYCTDSNGNTYWVQMFIG